jgi:hypothetical protein
VQAYACTPISGYSFNFSDLTNLVGQLRELSLH